MTWQHDSLDFSFDELRTRLEEALQAWKENPSGKSIRSADALEVLATQLDSTLASMSKSSIGDVSILKSVPALKKLAQTLERLDLGRPASPQKARVKRSAKTEDFFDVGMEHWWAGDRKTAVGYFKKVLDLDPSHADAHNHLGIADMDARKWKAAETHFRAAVAGHEPAVKLRAGCLSWSELDNRGYLRALANLALLAKHRHRYEEAVELHEKVLSLCPEDPLGVRLLLADEYYRLDDFETAIDIYRADPTPDAAYGLALTLFRLDRKPEAGLALVRAFSRNRYVAPLLLGTKPSRVPGFHFSNMEEPDWAAEYVSEAGDLWRSATGSHEFLKGWWEAEPVRSWIASLDLMTKQLGDLDVGMDRSRVVRERIGLTSDSWIRVVASRVDPEAGGAKATKLERPTPAIMSEVRITRSQDAADIEYTRPGVSPTRFVLGPEVESMTDEEILDAFNQTLLNQEAHRAEQKYRAVEIRAGQQQIEFMPSAGHWVAKGHVLRCIVGVREDDLRVEIDDHALTMSEFGAMLEVFEGWGMRITFVPEDRLEEVPRIEIRDHSKLN